MAVKAGEKQVKQKLGRTKNSKRKKRRENQVNNEVSLEHWLWKCACILRGPIEAPKYKNYILPLIFLKRLSDVFEDEVQKLAEEYGDIELAKEIVEADRSLVWFYIPEKARWERIKAQSANIGEYLTDAVRAVARENPKLHGVIDRVDFNATEAGQRILSDESLKALIGELSKRRLGLNDVEADILGRAYEYLLRKFAEDSGQSAGEFYTPREVAILMARLMDPEPGQEVYDPCAGSGGLLIKAHLRFKEKYGEDVRIEPLRFYGQEILPDTYAMAKMNVFIHRMEADIRLGNTMTNPAFTNPDGSLRKFDLVLANPMWNQDFDQSVYENDPYGRFVFGYPPSSSADWGWIQHMSASLKEDGRMAVVLDTGAVSRGSGTQGTNRERDIRKAFVEKDFIEAVILLPENLFYNTPTPGIILVVNKKKRHSGEIMLINASHLFEKGRPRNFLPDSAISEIAQIYLNWEEKEGLSKVITNEEAAKNDYNLSPSRYVAPKSEEEVLSVEEALVRLREAEEEREKADRELWEKLKLLGLGG
jgi:type I restriction enzyme M protein